MYKIKYTSFFVIFLVLIKTNLAFAGWWRDEEVKTVSADFGTIQFPAKSDNPDEVVSGSAIINVQNTGFKHVCDAATKSLSGTFVLTESAHFFPGEISVIDGASFLKLNDYISAAIQIKTGSLNSWAPFDAAFVMNYPYSDNKNACEESKYTPHSGNPSYVIKFLVKRPFIGRLDINAPLAILYAGDSENTAVKVGDGQAVFLKGSIIVPQSCEINAGQIITMDFGNIGASAFSQAGAGNRPSGINPQTRSIGINCKNIDAQAMLSLRIEANKVTGNAIVSDNPDLGFVVADGKQTPLTPNNVDSKIPFRLDDSASATVPISAWPVSVTGNKPAEGKFTSEGYLRVDFD